jgi:hypothetical protein
MTFNDFLKKHFRFACDIPYSTNVIKYGLEAVKMGLLHKDCVNDDGNCIALVLLDFAFCSGEPEACMPFLHEFFNMKPCLRQVCLRCCSLYGHRFVQFCMSFEYLWTDSFAVQQYWWAMPMDVHNKWSPCRVAWIWAVVQ